MKDNDLNKVIVTGAAIIGGLALFALLINRCDPLVVGTSIIRYPDGSVEERTVCECHHRGSA